MPYRNASAGDMRDATTRDGLSVTLRQDAPIALDVEFAVAPGEILALVGPSGSGKSTTLRAIAGLYAPSRGRVACHGSVWLDREGDISVPPRERRAGMVFQSYALFPHLTAVENVIEALGDGKIEQWRGRYRAVDALMLDDVQACIGKERTQEELFHLFNGLYSLGRQMVFSADRAPAAMSGLDDRLRSRFAGGLVAEIVSPDDELRRKLFARALATAGVAYDAELVDYLASWSTAGAVELKAMVEQLVEGARATGAQLDAAHARRLLEGEPAGDASDDEPRARARRVASPSGSMTAIRANGKAYDAILLDREKVIWDWPDVAGRAIEELR